MPGKPFLPCDDGYAIKDGVRWNLWNEIASLFHVDVEIIQISRGNW